MAVLTPPRNVPDNSPHVHSTSDHLAMAGDPGARDSTSDSLGVEDGVDGHFYDDNVVPERLPPVRKLTSAVGASAYIAHEVPSNF